MYYKMALLLELLINKYIFVIIHVKKSKKNPSKQTNCKLSTLLQNQKISLLRIWIETTQFSNDQRLADFVPFSRKVGGSNQTSNYQLTLLQD